MDEPYLGEIRSIAIPYAPRGWAFCNGQLMTVNSNQALFSLLGTTYGGDGRTTFALPDLRGRVPVGIGQLAGGSNYVLGQRGGQESVTLTQDQLGAHTHPVTGTIQAAAGNDDAAPSGDYPGGGNIAMYGTGSKGPAMGAITPGTTAAQGGSQPHDNRMPYLATNYVIAIQGIYPSRS